MAFIEYCAREHYWLNDFALYTLLKHQHNQSAWYEWPTELRDRDPKTLEQFTNKFTRDLDRIKWIQMTFDRQWSALHKFCESLQIRLLGDVPIYVAHDSAEVWTNRNLFTLDSAGQLTEVAGVPPDL
jgi:4-alpha-glucanotransferase